MQGKTWRSGPAAMGLGNAAVAASVATMLLAGPRVLSPSSFAGLGVAWTITTVFGFGLAVPLEQVWTRRLAAGGGRGRPQPRALAVAAVVILVAILAWAAHSPAPASFEGFAPSVGVGLVGWVVAAHVRSGVAGRADLRRYAFTLGLEASCRLVLVTLALLVPHGSSWLLAAAVGVPLATSACVLPGVTQAAANFAGQKASALEVPSVIGAAFGYQLCLNGIPLMLSTFGVAPAPLVGAFVLANSYLRVPTVLAGGYATQTLVREGGVGAGHLPRAVSPTVPRDVMVASGLAAGVVVLLLVASGPVLMLVLGRPPGLDATVLLALATSSVAAVASAVLTASFVGRGKAHVPVAAWASGAVATVVLVGADAGRLGAWFAGGIIAGPTLALALLGVQYQRSRGQRAH